MEATHKHHWAVKYRWEFMRRSPEYKTRWSEQKDKLPDPAKAYEDLHSIHRGRLLFSMMREAVSLPFIDEKPGEMNIRIDLSKVNSIPALKEVVCKTIDFYIEQAPGFGMSLPEREKRNKRDYDRILVAGQLRFEEGLKIQEIADRLFPDDFSPESALRKTHHCLRAFKELTMEGGYRNITFP